MPAARLRSDFDGKFQAKEGRAPTEAERKPCVKMENHIKRIDDELKARQAKERERRKRTRAGACREGGAGARQPHYCSRSQAGPKPFSVERRRRRSRAHLGVSATREKNNLRRRRTKWSTSGHRRET